MIDRTAALSVANTAIYTDSGADLPASLRADNVRVCPLTINFGQESFKDGVDITPEEFYARLSTTSVMPTTAQPSSAELADLYREALAEREYIVALHLSERVSGTAEAARAAAREMGADRISVIYTGQIACGLSLLISRVQEMLEAGTTLAGIEAQVDHFRANCLTLFTLESLEFLQRGGRIGRAQYMAGSLLKVRPILEVADGEVSSVGKVRGAHKVIPALAAALAESTPADTPLRVAIGHAQRPEAVGRVAQMVRETRPQASIEYTFELGPTIGTHGGPGTVGLSAVSLA
ncbi:MAG: DegV family protein [Thermoleophilia bacterium]|nr:DegV family protein [Thermoleophilia bacterium]MDH3725292.1 DegV family protein [Thermoleophilia bacterium]